MRCEVILESIWLNFHVILVYWSDFDVLRNNNELMILLGTYGHLEMFIDQKYIVLWEINVLS